MKAVILMAGLVVTVSVHSVAFAGDATNANLSAALAKAKAKAGTQLRVETPADTTDGWFHSFEAGALRLGVRSSAVSSREISIPADSVQAVWTKDHHGAMGALIGLGIGMTLGIIAAAQDGDGYALLYVPVFGGILSIPGYLIGGIMTTREQIYP